ncbi:MAG TPA: ATP-binding protein [Myxococcales bacterium]|nr:ATP-binding protein [Myxococcales bacterium]
MSHRRFGLRLRLLATLTGAGLLCAAALAVVLLLRARDEIVRRHVATARDDLRSVAESIASRCGSDAACAVEHAKFANVEWDAGASCSAPRAERRRVVCEEVAGAAVRRELNLSPASAQAEELVAPVLAFVLGGMALVVGLVFWLLERQLVAPLARIDAALDTVAEFSAGEALLPEGGDLLGRLAPAVNRLDVRLREERARVQAQIGELQASNEQLRAAREEVARNERLASVGRLAAGVAHEVGNPITAVIAYLDLLRDRLKQGKDVGDYVDRIARETERIDRILRDLLNLARAPGELQPVDLRVAAESARGLVQAQPSWNGCAIDVSVPADLPRARGENHYVVQVLLNLLVNAAKAGAHTVEMAGRLVDGAPIIEVTDDGRGLPPEAATRLFEPFFTTAAPGEGTGLGLALCHATMERFGGSISAKSRREGRGACFVLRFAAWS